MTLKRYIFRTVLIWGLFALAGFHLASHTESAFSIQISILKWGGGIFMFSATLFFQIANKIDKLREMRLNDDQASCLRTELASQRVLAVTRVFIVISMAFVIFSVSFFEERASHIWILSFSYGSFFVLMSNMVAIAYQYLHLSNLLDALNEDQERRKKLRDYRRDVHGI